MPSFGQPLKSNKDYENELNNLTGRAFPKTLIVVDGRLIQFSYETSWKSGSTRPVQTGQFAKMKVESEDKDGNSVIVEIETDTPIYDYVEDYTKEELTQEEIETINAWAQQNVEG